MVKNGGGDGGKVKKGGGDGGTREVDTSNINVLN